MTRTPVDPPSEGSADLVAAVHPRGSTEVRLAVHGDYAIGHDLVIDGAHGSGHVFIGRRGSLRVGDRVRVGAGTGIAVLERIEIGDDVHIGPYVSLADSDFHVAGDMGSAPEPRPIVIGSRVRIGAWTVVQPGSVIGDDVTIAPNSVVGGSVPPGATIAGNPAGPPSGTAGDQPEDVIAAVLGGTFGSETVLASLPAWDSLVALRLLTTLENAFGIRLDETTAAESVTVGDWLMIVERSVGDGHE